MNTHPRGIALPVVIIVLGVVLAAAITGIVVVQKRGTSPSPVANTAVVTNTNITANANTNVTTNTRVDTNTGSNTNTVTNTNTSTIPADWKTYSNTTYGYSIQYPPAYTPSGSAEKYQFQKGTLTGDPTHTLYIYTLTKATHAELERMEFSGEYGWFDWAMDGFPSNGTTVARLSTNKRQETYGVNTFTVINYDPGSSWNGMSFYYLVKNTTVFLITDFRVGAGDDETVHAMLASLQVISPTADWKTYTNTKYGYSVKYPKDWDASALPGDCLSENQPRPDPATHNPIGFVKGEDTRTCIGHGKAGTFIIDVGTAQTGPDVGGTISSRKDEKTITIGGLSTTLESGIFVPGGDPTGRIEFAYASVKKGSQYYEFTYGGEHQSRPDQGLFETFLSTFQFTE